MLVILISGFFKNAKICTSFFEVYDSISPFESDLKAKMFFTFFVFLPKCSSAVFSRSLFGLHDSKI